MAPAADDLSAAGTASYDSDTMSVGDGTWDFTKNSFLLPNLQGVNFDTMRYNGMGNRFSEWPEYHRIVAAHAVLAAIVFLFLVPFGIFAPRFMRSATKGKAWRAQMLLFGSLLLLASFMLGFFAVGPKRALTNPHHGIGVALFILYACYLLGDGITAHVKKEHSLRLYIHMWTGRVLTLLGLIQVPLGLTLYGSPRVFFILYAVYTGMLLFFYLCMDFVYGGPQGREVISHTNVEHIEAHNKHKSEKKWLAPLAAFAGFMMLKNLRGERSHSRARSMSRARSQSRVRSRSYSRSRIGTSELTSRRDSGSYLYANEKPPAKSGGFFGKLLAAGAALGGAKAASSWVGGRRDNSRKYDEEYSVVSTELSNRGPPHRPQDTESYFTDDYDSRIGTSRVADSRYTDSRYTVYADSRVTAPSGTAYIGADSMISAPVRPVRPVSRSRRHRSPSRTRSRSRHRSSSGGADRSRLGYIDDDGYESPSHRLAKKVSRENAVKGGILGGIGGIATGWLANKWRGQTTKEESEKLRREEEDLQSGVSGSRYTADDYGTPKRNPSNRYPGRTATTMSYFSDDNSSVIYNSRNNASTMPPTSTLPPSSSAPSNMPYSDIGSTIPPSTLPPNASRSDRYRNERSRSRSRGRYTDSEVSERERLDSVNSLPSRFARRTSSSRRRANADAEVRARDKGSVIARQEAEHMTRTGRTSQPPHRRSDDDDTSSSIVITKDGKSTHVKVNPDSDKDRVTLRRLTEEESAAARKDRQRRDSLSSLSGNETPTDRRYRRESARGGSGHDSNQPPSGSHGRRPGSSSKDPYHPDPRSPGGYPELSTIESQDSFVSPSANDSSLAENNRRRRRMERRQTVTSADYPDL